MRARDSSFRWSVIGGPVFVAKQGASESDDAITGRDCSGFVVAPANNRPREYK